MRTLLASLLAATLLYGCGGDAQPAGVIDRETFVSTWVELRRAAMGYRDGVLPADARARVLGAGGVSAEQLLAFVETHGNDPRYMIELWEEVDERMRPPPAPDTVPESPLPGA